MAINISILSHAFVLGKEIAPIQVSMSNDQPSVAKEYQQYSLERVRKADYGEEGESITSLQKQFSSLDAKKLSPSPGNEGGEAWNSKREKGEPPITPETSRDRCVERGERLSSERIRSVDRGDRPPMPERVYSRSPTAESALSRSPNADREKAEVLMSAVRSECASTLGIDSDELELYGLCHIPPTVERGRLLKDSSGMMHLGVLVKRSELTLQSIEQLISDKYKAEKDVENYKATVRDKRKELEELTVKSENLLAEVVCLRSKLEHANQIRKASEKSTEKLRVEFDKLINDFFTDAEHIHMSQLLTAAAGEFGEPSKIKFILPAVNEDVQGEGDEFLKTSLLLPAAQRKGDEILETDVLYTARDRDDTLMQE